MTVASRTIDLTGLRSERPGEDMDFYVDLISQAEGALANRNYPARFREELARQYLCTFFDRSFGREYRGTARERHREEFVEAVYDVISRGPQAQAPALASPASPDSTFRHGPSTIGSQLKGLARLGSS